MISDMFFYVLDWPNRYDFVRRHADELPFSERIFVAPLWLAMIAFPVLAVAFVVGMFAYKASLAMGPYFPPISGPIGYLLLGTGVLLALSGALSILGLIVVHDRGDEHHRF